MDMLDNPHKYVKIIRKTFNMRTDIDISGNYRYDAKISDFDTLINYIPELTTRLDPM